MSQSRPSLEEIFETHIQTLALTRRPATVSGYRGAARRFLSFLRTDFPGLSRLSQLRRDPHLLGCGSLRCHNNNSPYPTKPAPIICSVSVVCWTI